MMKRCSIVIFLLFLVMLSQGFFVNADTPHTILLGTNDDHPRPTINGNISVVGTQCTDTEKRHFQHCETSKVNRIGADWSDRICDALDSIVKECFPILKSCLVESTIDNEVESYLRGYVAAQKDHASKLKIKQCAIVQEYLGSDECTQSMLNQKYGEWFQCNLKTFKSLEQQLLILKKTNAGVHPIIRNRSRMYSTRARPGTNLPLRSNIQKEFCNALRSLTVGMCGKIAERCEPNATLETFRYTHRVNVGEALNKFIFGNVKLFDNNFIKVEQCNQVDVWEEEIDGSGAKFDTDVKEEDTWILDGQSSATEKPLAVDLPLQQPLKSRGITLGINPFLQFGEIGIIMYPVLYRTF